MRNRAPTRPLAGLLFALVVAACAGGAADVHAPPELADCERLSGPEIRRLFSDVEDRAVVHDGAGGRARNRWCADGAFVSTWETVRGSGRLQGEWRVQGDERCVTVAAGLPGGGASRCSPLYRCDRHVVSVNAGGGVHGVHSLSPADCTADFD